jgi:hypothetical protein
MKTLIGIVITSMLLAACASSGVVPMDKGSYLITKRSAQVGVGPPVGVKADVYVEANEFCQKQGKEVETVNLNMYDTYPARPGGVELQFKCIPK